MKYIGRSRAGTWPCEECGIAERAHDGNHPYIPTTYKDPRCPWNTPTLTYSKPDGIARASNRVLYTWDR